MSEYEQTLTMQAPPADVVAFIADIGNLPKYLPTTKSAQPQGEDRVRVQGEANQHRYDSDGYLRCDREAGRIEWGADEGYYSGSMEVREDGGPDSSTVTVRISMRGTPPGADEGNRPSDDDINQGMMASLRSIQNHVEGRGGKEEPAAAT